MGVVLLIASHIGKAGKKGEKSCEDAFDHFHPREIAYNSWVWYIFEQHHQILSICSRFFVNFCMEADFFFSKASYSRIGMRMMIRASCFES